MCVTCSANGYFFVVNQSVIQYTTEKIKYKLGMISPHTNILLDVDWITSGAVHSASEDAL